MGLSGNVVGIVRFPLILTGCFVVLNHLVIWVQSGPCILMGFWEAGSSICPYPTLTFPILWPRGLYSKDPNCT